MRQIYVRNIKGQCNTIISHKLIIYFALKYVSPEILGTSVPVYYETREWHAVTPDLSQEAALGRSTPRHSALAHLDT